MWIQRSGGGARLTRFRDRQCDDAGEQCGAVVGDQNGGVLESSLGLDSEFTELKICRIFLQF